MNNKLKINSLLRNKSGFTLIEIMLVIALVAALAFFTIKYSSQRFGDQLIDRTAAETVNIKRAALNHFTKVGVWPDGDNDCTNAEAVLRQYIGQNNQNAWGYAYTYSCPAILTPAPLDEEGQQQEPLESIPSFIISQQAPSHKTALQLARVLPAADVNIIDGAYYVDTYIPMVMMPPTDDNTSEAVSTPTHVEFTPRRCTDNTFAQIIVVPKSICSATESHQFYGYQINIENSEVEGGIMKQISIDVMLEDGSMTDAFDACGTFTEYADMLSIHEYCPND